MVLRDLLRVLGSSSRRDGRNLTHGESYRAFHAILDGSESEIRITAFLMAMRWKGITVEELTGFARAAREVATLPCQDMRGLVCISPPLDGYDERPPLEVAAGLVAAASGTKVLIVTEKGVPPRRGLTAAPVLEHMRVPTTWDPVTLRHFQVVVPGREADTAVQHTHRAEPPVGERRGGRYNPIAEGVISDL